MMNMRPWEGWEKVMTSFISIRKFFTILMGLEIHRNDELLYYGESMIV